MPAVTRSRLCSRVSGVHLPEALYHRLMNINGANVCPCKIPVTILLYSASESGVLTITFMYF